jgi:hypothetical protein
MDYHFVQKLMKEKSIEINESKELVVRYRAEIIDKGIIDEVDDETIMFPIALLYDIKSIMSFIRLNFSIPVSIDHIHLIQSNKLWLEAEHAKIKETFENLQSNIVAEESTHLFEYERIQEILKEQLTIYGEWVDKLSEARLWFEEAKKLFYNIKKSTLFSKLLANNSNLLFQFPFLFRVFTLPVRIFSRSR